MPLICVGIAEYFLPGTAKYRSCREAIMTHFQGWKRDYYKWTMSVPPANAHVTVVTEHGVVYLKLDNLENETQKLPTYGDLLSTKLNSGRVIPGDIISGLVSLGKPDSTTPMYIHRLIGKKLNELSPSMHLRDLTKLLKYNDTFSRSLELVTDYCIVYKSNFGGCGCAAVGSDIKVIRRSRANRSNLTLITVAWADEIVQNGHLKLFDSWGDDDDDENKVFFHGY